MTPEEEIKKLKEELETKNKIILASPSLAQETTLLAATWQSRYTDLLVRTQEKWNNPKRLNGVKYEYGTGGSN